MFFETYWRLIYNAAIRSGLTDQEAQDVVQETVLCVARTMPKFKYQPEVCSFKGWLLHLTRCRIADQWRKRPVWQRPPSGAESLTFRARPVDPESLDDQFERLWDQEWKTELAAAALQKLKQDIKPKHYQAFDLYVMRNWPPGEVARATHLSIAQVYLIRHRVGRKLKRILAKLEQGIL